jgi:hypothetical protein
MKHILAIGLLQGIWLWLYSITDHSSVSMMAIPFIVNLMLSYRITTILFNSRRTAEICRRLRFEASN